MQIEETERLKHNLMKSKENSNSSMLHSHQQNTSASQQPRVTFSFTTDEGFSSHSNSTNTSHHQYSSQSDECAQLRSQLKDANMMIDELKVNFRKNLFDLQSKLQECIDDKERLQIKKFEILYHFFNLFI